MFGFLSYNYDHFTRDLLRKDLRRVGGPEAGQWAPDFEGRTLQGETIVLSNYRGDQNVVLTFGSGTCPFTAVSIPGMNALCEQFKDDDVQFLFCYIREAHPGERLPFHHSYEEKQRAADLLRREEDLQMPVIVDNLKGTIHRRYGKLPNATYLIDKSGRVAFRSLWSRPSAVKTAIEELLEHQQDRNLEHAVVNGGEDASMPSARAMLRTFQALDRGGRQAIRDFEREMGMPGRLAVGASRAVQPMTENLGRSALVAGATLGVIAAGVVLGRYLRSRRLGWRNPYYIESFGMPPRATESGQGDYEAVGI